MPITIKANLDFTKPTPATVSKQCKIFYSGLQTQYEVKQLKQYFYQMKQSIYLLSQCLLKCKMNFRDNYTIYLNFKNQLLKEMIKF